MEKKNTTQPASRTFKELHAAKLQELATDLWFENKSLKKALKEALAQIKIISK